MRVHPSMLVVLGLLSLQSACQDQLTDASLPIDAAKGGNKPPSGTVVDPWVDVSGGGGTVCGLKKSGKLFCWGQNGWLGALGNGTTAVELGFSTIPLQVSGEQKWAQFSTGYLGTCAVNTRGEAYCWKANYHGVLGIGKSSDEVEYSPIPVRVTGTQKWRLIRHAGAHVCGLTRDGKAWCWGNNNHGELGDGTTQSRNAPVQVAGDMTWIDLKVGGWATCGIREDGVEFCWGEPTQGAGWTSLPAQTSVWNWGAQAQALGLMGVTPVAEVASCARDGDYLGYCWGGGGALGVGPVDDPYSPVVQPTAMASTEHWQSFSSGGFAHVCGITLDGRGFCWGSNHVGELGDGSVIDQNAPSAIATSLLWKTLAVVGGEYGNPGYNSTCGLATDGVIYCWGSNYAGQLGDLVDVGLDHYSTTPVQISEPSAP